MNFRALQWSKAIGYVAGGGCAVIFALGGPRWTAIGIAVAAAAGLLNVLIPAPSKTSVPDPQVIGPSGAPTGATLISTSSELLPGNTPAKGNPKMSDNLVQSLIADAKGTIARLEAAVGSSVSQPSEIEALAKLHTLSTQLSSANGTQETGKILVAIGGVIEGFFPNWAAEGAFIVAIGTGLLAGGGTGSAGPIRLGNTGYTISWAPWTEGDVAINAFSGVKSNPAPTPPASNPVRPVVTG